MRSRALALSLLILATASVQGARASSVPVVRAGVGSADITWNVGSGQGQYGTNRYEGVDANRRFDPYAHGVNHAPSIGVQGRIAARALVIEGTDGTRVAYVGNDLYVLHDMIQRRVGQLVEAAGVGIDRRNIMIGDSHNHSAPYAATTTWGFWLFADAFDYRHFDELTTKMAAAIIEAAGNLRPVRMGATVRTLTEVQQNILGPAVADDGTPAGFPRDWFDPELAVIRFDDISDPDAPTPYATLVNLGMHPESMDTTDLISPDFVGTVRQIVDRTTGAMTIWSQGAVGDSEPDRDARANPPSAQREYWHRDFSQAEKMSRIIAGRVIHAWDDVAAETPQFPEKFVPFSSDFPVQMIDRVFPGPASHPVPTISNCRTDAASRGKPATPVTGLPDCTRGSGPDAGVAYDAAREHDIPLPESYGSAPGYTGAYDRVTIHLQVLRLGEVLLASCPCEPVTDMVRNFKTRTDEEHGNGFDGFDWPCAPSAKTPGGYTCDYRTAAWRDPDLREVSGPLYERMRAQVHNDAAGWDDEDAEGLIAAEAEPRDVRAIKGNFTHEEIQARCGSCGFRLPLMMGMTNDYIGYIVTYREYMRGDHYRKALTAYGPHTADYVNTRLVRMAAQLLGGAAPAAEALDAKVAADEAALDAQATALGALAARARAAYEASLPNDGGTPRVVVPAATTPRFSAAQVRWIGGSNYTDDPRVRVLRREGDDWLPFADQDGGEIVVNAEFRDVADPTAVAGWASGTGETLWTATFEVIETTPEGEYRFEIEGRHRTGRARVSYALASEFTVAPFGGLTVAGASVDLDAGTVTIVAPPVDYPRTYVAQGVPYISAATTATPTGTYCFRCTFRPWATRSTTASVTVTVISGAVTSEHDAVNTGGNTWVAPVPFGDADEIWLMPGGVRDTYGNVNGDAIPLML